MIAASHNHRVTRQSLFTTSHNLIALTTHVKFAVDKNWDLAALVRDRCKHLAAMPCVATALVVSKVAKACLPLVIRTFVNRQLCTVRLDSTVAILDDRYLQF
jgi:hypothetical protein